MCVILLLLLARSAAPLLCFASETGPWRELNPHLLCANQASSRWTTGPAFRRCAKDSNLQPRPSEGRAHPFELPQQANSPGRIRTCTKPLLRRPPLPNWATGPGNRAGDQESSRSREHQRSVRFACSVFSRLLLTSSPAPLLCFAKRNCTEQGSNLQPSG